MKEQIQNDHDIWWNKVQQTKKQLRIAIELSQIQASWFGRLVQIWPELRIVDIPSLLRHIDLLLHSSSDLALWDIQACVWSQGLALEGVLGWLLQEEVIDGGVHRLIRECILIAVVCRSIVGVGKIEVIPFSSWDVVGSMGDVTATVTVTAVLLVLCSLQWRRHDTIDQLRVPVWNNALPGGKIEMQH